MKKLSMIFCTLLAAALLITGCAAAKNQTVNNNQTAGSSKNDKSKTSSPVNVSDKKTVSEKKPDVPANLSDEEICKLTVKADNAIAHVFSPKNVDTEKDIINKNDKYGRTYGKSLNYSSKKAAKEYLSDYFDEKGIDKFMDDITLEQNGKLYIVIGQAGMRPDFKTSNMKKTVENNKIQVEFSTKLSDTDTAKESKTLIFKNNKWLFQDLWYTN